MILTLTASIMYWSLQQPSKESEQAAAEKPPSDREDGETATDGGSELAHWWYYLRLCGLNWEWKGLQWDMNEKKI